MKKAGRRCPVHKNEPIEARVKCDYCDTVIENPSENPLRFGKYLMFGIILMFSDGK